MLQEGRRNLRADRYFEALECHRAALQCWLERLPRPRPDRLPTPRGEPGNPMISKAK
jgi:hypothetical protein